MLALHQIEQFLFYTGAKDATVVHSKIANYNHPDTPELDDFGDATLVACLLYTSDAADE